MRLNKGENMQSVLCRIQVKLPLGTPTAKGICFRGSGAGRYWQQYL